CRNAAGPRGDDCGFSLPAAPPGEEDGPDLGVWLRAADAANPVHGPVLRGVDDRTSAPSLSTPSHSPQGACGTVSIYRRILVRIAGSAQRRGLSAVPRTLCELVRPAPYPAARETSRLPHLYPPHRRSRPGMGIHPRLVRG